MKTTTLVTFMLQHPSARYVELYGSWDNFSEPWQMKRDSRRGWGNWTGCHRFSNVIYDGDSASFHEKRDGGLKMGGTYWYYYRIDRDEEYYDPSQPSTSSCPLLPGQYLNVLEVPFEKRFISRSRSSSVSLITEFHTLNPEDRYLTPRPAPKPRLPKLMTKLDQSEIRAWSAAPPEEPQSALGHRATKSASSAPINPFTLRMDRVKSPVSARPPGVGGRGRSIRLQSAPNRFESTQPLAINTSSSFDKPSEYSTLQPPYSAGPVLSNINFSKLRAPYSSTTLHGPFSVSGEQDDVFLEPNFPRRAVTAPVSQEHGHHLHRRAFSHESGLKGASSAFHQVCADEVVVPPSFYMPDSITEADENSPPRVTQRRSLKTDSISLNTSSGSRPETAKANVNKALPELPAYLIPSPLFSHSFTEPSEQAKDLFRDFNFRESRFSAWTEDLNGSDVDDSDVEVGDGRSSTFSSVWESGHTSPLRFSDPFYSSLGVDGDDDDKAKESQDHDAASQQLDSDMALVKDGYHGESHTRREMTQMEQLLDEFEYLGAALL